MAASRSKTALSKDKIIETALNLVEETGAEAVSFRNIATRLDVTPMALYRHFGDKQELLALMLDRFIEQSVVLPKKELIWDKWLQYVGKKMYEALIQQPSWIPLLGEIPLQTSGLKVMNECLRVLTKAGFSRSQAVEGFLVLMHCLLGASLMYCQLNHSQQLLLKRIKEQNDEDIAGYTEVIESASLLQKVPQMNQMTLSLTVMIEGMRGQIE